MLPHVACIFAQLLKNFGVFRLIFLFGCRKYGGFVLDAAEASLKVVPGHIEMVAECFSQFFTFCGGDSNLPVKRGDGESDHSFVKTSSAGELWVMRY